jgi:cyclopropane-fatty-acyl-phospholipid synthase
VPGSLAATIEVDHPGTYRRVLRQGSVGLGESYADGWWDTPDLTSLLRVLDRDVRRADPLLSAWHGLTNRVADPLRRLRRPDRGRDRRNIQAHYDVSNAFFERMLDETMMYSCAVFPDADASLADASNHKIDLLCRRMHASPDDHLLEIGTGWGGFAVRAAEQFGCRVTTTTISDAQYEYARDRVRMAGLENRVTVLPLDYRDLEGRFDGIVSIEMIEAVDWREYDTFFAACSRLLGPSGRLAMQAIVIPERRFEQAKTRKDFVKQVIFPGGCLPSVDALVDAAARVSDLALVDIDEIGAHYPETLRRWRRNMARDADDLASMGLDSRFARLWEFYLAYCEAGFEERDVSVVQLVMAKPAWPVGARPTLDQRTAERPSPRVGAPGSS